MISVKFKIGDKVFFLNEKGGGIITAIISNTRVQVLNKEGFEVSYLVEELVPASKKSDYKMETEMNKVWREQKDEQEITPPKLDVNEIWEVDLHLHELTNSLQQKGDYEKLMFQIKYFRKCMDAAITHHIRKIIFIHGIGKGTLKEEIIHELRHYERVRYFNAPFKKYGYGALMLEFI